MFTLFEFLFLLGYSFLIFGDFLFLMTSSKMATILKYFCCHFVYFEVVYNCTKFDVYIICRSGIKGGLMEPPSNTEPLKSPVLIGLTEEILMRRNFGEFAHSQNPTHFGGIYFGGYKIYIFLAGVNFGRYPE